MSDDKKDDGLPPGAYDSLQVTLASGRAFRLVVPQEMTHEEIRETSRELLEMYRTIRALLPEEEAKRRLPPPARAESVDTSGMSDTDAVIAISGQVAEVSLAHLWGMDQKMMLAVKRLTEERGKLSIHLTMAHLDRVMKDGEAKWGAEKAPMLVVCAMAFVAGLGKAMHGVRVDPDVVSLINTLGRTMGMAVFVDQKNEAS